MASFSGLALLLCFGLLAGPTGSYAFDAMRAAHPTPGIAALALLLALIGAGSKAGVVPVHAWLPESGFATHTVYTQTYPGPFPFLIEADYPGAKG